MVSQSEPSRIWKKYQLDSHAEGFEIAQRRLMCKVRSFALAALLAVNISNAQDQARGLQPSAPEVALGDRLFFETRFAQYFFAHSNGDVNVTLDLGDPIVESVQRPSQTDLSGPFRGQSVSCRHCHLGDDFIQIEPLAQRTYCDFSARSRIPQRNDRFTQTVRNTPIMIDLGLPSEIPQLRHYDGEFVSTEELIVNTLVGRNMGWRIDEYSIAIGHIARVVREDVGMNARYIQDQQGHGIPYRVVLLGTDPSLSPRLRLPMQYRLDVQSASDHAVLEAIAKLMHAYIDSLRFGTEDTNRTRGSPYDLFLEKNNLPRKAAHGESNQAYSQRLISLIEKRNDFNWVTQQQDGRFRLHSHAYQFGEMELTGLKIFFARKGVTHGNCVACHIPPQFTDNRFHNTGVSQFEYDSIFGIGAFARLYVPDLTIRNAQYDTYLPASRQHPNATSRFRAIPSREKPGFADLGVWNVFANPDLPRPQLALTEILCSSAIPVKTECKASAVLPLTLALFKTPSIRDLGHSNPYLHSGTASTIEDVLNFYVTAAALAREGQIRNGSQELLGVHIDESDIPPLAAFLRSLDEDYH